MSEEYDAVAPVCRFCSIEMRLLGQLGRLLWWRCPGCHNQDYTEVEEDEG